MIYCLINPGDGYTLKADDSKVAIMVCLILGNGQYVLKDESDKQVCPCLLFGGSDEFIKEEYGGVEGYKKFFETHKKEIADCLDSVMIWSFRDRKTYDNAFSRVPDENKEAYRKHLHDKNRRSMNDIGKLAWETAAKIREMLKSESNG